MGRERFETLVHEPAEGLFAASYKVTVVSRRRLRASRVLTGRALPVRPFLNFNSYFRRPLGPFRGCAERPSLLGSRPMSENPPEEIRQMLDTVYRAESGRILATLIRLLGDFDLAEDAMQDAFAVALDRWSQDGVPDNPRAWLVSTARFKAIDALRRRARFDASQEKIAGEIEKRNPARPRGS